MRRGEVRWYKFSSPDKRRPVVILTRDSAIDYLGEVTIAPITRTIREGPSEVVLTRADGLPEDSAVNLHHVQTVSRGKLGGLITTLTEEKMQNVKKALLFA
ncbi:MAG: PemK family transcriptional regulator, partial [Acidobacteria bacterium]